MSNYILGLSCYYHDSAVALIKDGEIGAACLKWSFDHAVYKNGVNELRNGKGML